MNRKTLLTSCILFCAVILFTAKAQDILSIYKTDGTAAQIALPSLRKLYFSTSNLMINKTSGTNEEISLSSIQRITFNSVNGIAPVKTTSQAIKLYPIPARKYISLKNAPEGEFTVEIFNITGSLTLTQKLIPTSQPIDVSKLPSGLYLMRVNHQTIKFTKL